MDLTGCLPVPKTIARSEGAHVCKIYMQKAVKLRGKQFAVHYDKFGRVAWVNEYLLGLCWALGHNEELQRCE